MFVDKILHLDIVAHASAVWLFVIVAEHGKTRKFADRHSRGSRHEVVRYAVRIFSKEAAWVRAHWVNLRTGQFATLPGDRYFRRHP
jgi:hypothetical protein